MRLSSRARTKPSTVTEGCQFPMIRCSHPWNSCGGKLLEIKKAAKMLLMKTRLIEFVGRLIFTVRGGARGRAGRTDD